MPTTQLSDVVVLQEFTAYQIQNSMVSTAFYQSGVLVPNAEISSQLQTDSQSFTDPPGFNHRTSALLWLQLMQQCGIKKRSAWPTRTRWAPSLSGSSARL